MISLRDIITLTLYLNEFKYLHTMILLLCIGYTVDIQFVFAIRYIVPDIYIYIYVKSTHTLVLGYTHYYSYSIDALQYTLVQV